MSHSTPPVTLDMALRRALADRRMSGRQLAKAAGLPVGPVARSLRGDRDLTVAELTAIAGALGMTPSDLIPGPERGTAA